MLSATCKGTFFPVILGIFLFFCHGTANAWSLVCESIDGQSRYCRADTRGGVQLVRQLSKSGCYEGQTWGYDRRGVWVTAGCRGVFELGGMYAYPHEDRYVDERNHFREERRHRRVPQRITCESWGNRPNYCPAPVHRRQVQIERQFSATRCRYGENWGWDRDGIWVKNGCRAVFSVY